jgi:hypothetical protein
MRKIKEVLRLTHHGKFSARQVPQSLNLSRSARATDRESIGNMETLGDS